MCQLADGESAVFSMDAKKYAYQNEIGVRDLVAVALRR